MERLIGPKERTMIEDMNQDYMANLTTNPNEFRRDLENYGGFGTARTENGGF